MQDDEDISGEHFVDALPALAWTSASDRGGTWFNAVWREWTGARASELVGWGFLDVIHPEDRERVAASCRSGSSVTEETNFRIRGREGSWRWLRDLAADRADGLRVRLAFDCTERRGAEEAARLDDERTEIAQDPGSFGTYDWDLSSGRVLMSPQLAQLLGIDPSTGPDAVCEAWAERVHPEDLAAVRETLDRALEAGDDFQVSYRIVLPVGDERWIEGRGRALRDAEGRATRLIGVNSDVTQRRRSEEALAQHERLLHDFLADFPAVVFRRITYPDGRMEYPYLSDAESPVYQAIRGRFAEVRTIEDAASIVHPDDAADLVRRYRHSLETLAPLDFKGRLVGDGGEVRWIRSLSRPRPRGEGVLVWDGVVIDVTEERERESERERAKAALDLAMEVAGVGTLEHDPVTGEVSTSASTASLFGIESDGLPRNIGEYLSRVHPDDRAAVDAFIDRLQSGGAPEALNTGSCCRTAPDGGWWCGQHWSRWRTAGGGSSVPYSTSQIDGGGMRSRRPHSLISRDCFGN